MAGKINIGDTWKEIAGQQINIGDTWKTIQKAHINIGDTWKEWYSALSAPTDYIAYYNLNSNSNDTTGNYNMTQSGSQSYAAGKIGNCLSNLSSSVYSYINNNMGIGGGSCSVCLWGYVTSYTGDHPPFFSHYDNTAKVDYRIGITSSQFFVARHAPGITWGEIKTSYNANTWVHLALTYNTSTGYLKMYKNGSYVDQLLTTTNGTGSYTTSTRIGRGNATAVSYLTSGKVDEVYVFNRELSSDEVLSIYNLT